MAQDQYVHAYCPECGSRLSFTGGKKKISCTNCNYSRELGRYPHPINGRHTDQVSGRKLDANVRIDHMTRGLGREMAVFACGGCGSHLGVNKGQVITVCPFCQTPDPEPVDKPKDPIRPYQIIPFKISRKSAASRLRQRVKGFWLAPGIEDIIKPENLRGVYVPAFAFDALTRNSWRGEAAFTYMKIEKGKEVQRMAWDNTTGYYEHFFDNLDITISEGLDGKGLEEIEPYNLRHCVPYDPAYLDNWVTECYQISEKEGFGVAEGLTSQIINIEIQNRLPGEKIRKLSITSEKQLIAFRHILLPVWVASFRYKGELFQYLVNGHTGAISGVRPLSNMKMYIAVGAGLALITLLTWIIGYAG